MQIEALSMGDLPLKREGYVHYVAAHHKVADRLRNGWELVDCLPVFAGEGQPPSFLLCMAKDEYDRRRLQKQLRNDLISASRGVDDGKDLRQYADRHFYRRWNVRMMRWSIWRLARCKWQSMAGTWYSKIYRMFVGVEEGRVWP